MGYFQKRHGEQTNTMTSTGRSYYRERHQKEIPKSQNVLQRALKTGATTASTMLGSNPAFSSMMPGTVEHEARAMKSKAIGGITKNPLLGFGLDIATDPLTYAGGVQTKAIGGPVVKSAGKFLKEAPRNVRLRSELGKSGRIQNTLQQALEKRRYNIGKKFGGTLSRLTDANPEKAVDGVSDVLGNYASNPELSKVLERLPSSKSILNRGQSLSSMIEGKPIEGTNVKEVQRLINELEEVFPFKKPGETSVFDLDGRRLISELRDLQASAFPEMKGARAAFRKGAEAYKTVKGKLASKTPEGEIRRGFGSKGRIKEAAREALPPQANRLIKRIHTGENIVKAGKAGAIAAPVFGAGVGLWKFINSLND